LTESELSLLRDAFEDAPFEFWVRDLDGRCIIANADTRRLGGVIGQKVEDAQVPPEVILSWQANNRRAFAGEVVQNEFEYGVGAHRRYLQCYIVPLRIEGEIKGLLGFNIDVTAHERTAQALRESERRLSEAMQIGRMGWLDWDLVTNEMRWSPETYRLFGYEPGRFSPTIEATVGMVPAEDLTLVRERLDAVIEGTRPYDLVHRMIRADGAVIHVHSMGEVMRDEQGKPLRMLGTVVDVTERKRVEDELREVDRRRGEFLGVLSHELRNPLAVIGTSVRCIDPAALAHQPSRRAISAIERQTQHLTRLVDDLLDVTRVSSGKINLQRSRVDLAQIVRTTVEDHRELLAAHAVSTQLPDTPVWTDGDSTRLAQVVGNLLSNAVKFTPAGGKISVSLAVTSGRAVIEVVDTGVGIDAESLRRLFTPFVQAARSAARSRAGLGLGLALVKTLVEMHGGDVRAHSAGPGQGASLTITVPVVDLEPVESPVMPAISRTPRNVLIIEDDPDVAEWLAEALTFSGHQVTISLDGSDGLEKARELGPDVVLCDIGLPGTLDGYAVARTLRQDAALARPFRVALSGYAQPEDQRRAREAGFEAHFSKPPDLEALERLLAELPKRGTD
jgi:PAS domain S-box-containing protein